MQQHEPGSFAAMIRGSRRLWLAGTLALLFIFLLWHQSSSFSTDPSEQATPPIQQKPDYSSPKPVQPPKTHIPAENEDADFNPPPPKTSNEWTPPPLPEGDEKLTADAPKYVKAIMDPTDISFPRLVCPAPTSGRYDYLVSSTPPTTRKYFFALNLHECAGLLPRLMGSIVETIRFLGPQNCALSVVEGRSDDGTFEILKTLATDVEALGAKYYFSRSEINPVEEGNDRIEKLAELRNLAVQPLVENAKMYHADATVLFINDVSICMEDILELIHQKVYQSADMTCAMDWIFGGSSFYDVWVSRGMNGDQFFEIPQSGSWDFAGNLFWNDPYTKKRLESKIPFQVFSCWNGAVAFTAKPVLQKKIKFRSALKQECYLGEPTHFCKDMWKSGFGKIAVVPSVNLGYFDDQSLASKNANGWTGSTVQEQESQGKNTKVDWKIEPPELIKCVPTYQNPTWVAWDQALGGQI